jgi:hypothetical protein
MAYFIYNGDVHIPTGYRVVAFGKAFYKGGNAVQFLGRTIVEKLRVNPSFIEVTKDIANKGVLTDKVAQDGEGDDTEKLKDDDGEPELTEEDIDEMTFEELGEQLDELEVENKPRSSEDRRLALKDALNIG